MKNICTKTGIYFDFNVILKTLFNGKTSKLHCC